MELKKNLRIKTTPLQLKKYMIYFKDYRFTMISESLIRVERCEFTDEATISVFNRLNDFGKDKFKVNIDNDLLTIETKEYTLYFDSNLKFDENYVVFKRDKNKTKRYLNNDYNLKGTMRTLDTFFNEGFCVDRSVTEFRIDTLPLENGVMSKNGVSIIDDSKSPILGKDSMVHERVETEMDSYIFLSLDDYMLNLKNLYLITLKPPLVPKFAFGNWWSRYHQYTDTEYLSLLDRFMVEEVPISVATIDMDWHYVDIVKDFKLEELGRMDESKYGSTSGWTGFTWNPKLFPNYKKFLKELKDRGYYTTLNLHPRDGIRWFEEMYPLMTKDTGIDPKSLAPVEFDMTNEAFINSYFNRIMKKYEKEGIDFYWIDYQQDRTTKIKNLDPLWPLNHYHYLDSKNSLILSRYSGVGSHRYPVGFSGDTKMTWDFLDFMPYFTLTASNIGYGYWSHDIGAHHYGIKDDDLYTRWIEFGVFSPINRIHSNIMDCLSKEPWLNKSEVRLITDYYLRFRHRLIPYLYHYSIKAEKEGDILIKPLYYLNPKDEETYKDNYTYYFGETIVSPITKKRINGYSVKEVYLPDGVYYDYFTHMMYKGKRWVKVNRDLGEIPFFLKANTIVPLSNTLDTHIKESSDMEINVLGDNASLDFNISENTITKFRLSKLGSKIKLSIISNNIYINNTNYRIEFRDIQNASPKVLLNGKVYPYKINRAYNFGIILENVVPTDEIVIELSNIHKYSFKEYLDKFSLDIISEYNYINEDKNKIFEYIRDNINNPLELKEYLKTLKEHKDLAIKLEEIMYFE